MCGCFTIIGELVSTSSDPDSIGVFFFWTIGGSASRIGHCFVSWNFMFVDEVENVLPLGSVEALEQASVLFFIAPVP